MQRRVGISDVSLISSLVQDNKKHVKTSVNKDDHNSLNFSQKLVERAHFQPPQVYMYLSYKILLPARYLLIEAL